MLIYLIFFHIASAFYWAIVLGYKVSSEETYLQLKELNPDTTFIFKWFIVSTLILNLLGGWIAIAIDYFKDKKYYPGYVKLIAQIVAVREQAKKK